jgi:ankyrin repeat protein
MCVNLSEESDFIKACAKGDEKIAQELLATDSELIGKVTSNGSTPLMVAVSKGLSEIVELLLRNKADINALSSEGETALWLATYHKKWELAEKLLEAGAKNLDVTPTEGVYREVTALWFAASALQWRLVEKLLKAGAKNLDTTPAEGDDRGKTALWLAAGNQQWLLVIKLLEAGVKNLDATPVVGVNRKDTALWFATLRSVEGELKEAQGESLKLLLKRGASLFPYPTSPIARIDTTMTPRANLLCTAANRLHELASDEKFMQKKLNSFLGDLEESLNGRIDGMTALHTAVLKKNKGMVEALVLKNANLLLKNREGKTAAALAVECSLDVPILAAHTFLCKLKVAIDELHSERSIDQETKELEELKVEGENKRMADTLERNSNNKVEAILKRKDAFLAGIDRIEPCHRNTIWFEYGSLLEKMLPAINEKEIKAAFEKVTFEKATREVGLYQRDLYQRAQAQLNHYAMLESGRYSAPSSLSLDDEDTEQEDNRGLIIRSAVNAGTHGAPSMLKAISYQYVYGDKLPTRDYNGSSDIGEVVLGVFETCKNKIKEIEDENKKLKEEILKLRSQIHFLSVTGAGSETIVASSSSSSTLMSVSPLLFSTGAAAEVEALSTQLPIVSRRRKAENELSLTPEVFKRGRGVGKSNIIIVNKSLTFEAGALSKKAY